MATWMLSMPAATEAINGVLVSVSEAEGKLASLMAQFQDVRAGLESGISKMGSLPSPEDNDGHLLANVHRLADWTSVPPATESIPSGGDGLSSVCSSVPPGRFQGGEDSVPLGGFKGGKDSVPSEGFKGGTGADVDIAADLEELQAALTRLQARQGVPAEVRGLVEMIESLARVLTTELSLLAERLLRAEDEQS